RRAVRNRFPLETFLRRDLPSTLRDTLWLKLPSLGDQPLFLVALSRHQINGGSSRQVKQNSGSVLRQCPHFCRLAYFSPASSRIAASVARPLSVSAYTPVSRLCAMNPRIAIDRIAWARIPTAAWSMPVAVQNRITRSCAVSFVVVFDIALLPLTA